MKLIIAVVAAIAMVALSFLPAQGQVEPELAVYWEGGYIHHDGTLRHIGGLGNPEITTERWVGMSINFTYRPSGRWMQAVSWSCPRSPMYGPDRDGYPLVGWPSACVGALEIAEWRLKYAAFLEVQ